MLKKIVFYTSAFLLLMTSLSCEKDDTPSRDKVDLQLNKTIATSSSNEFVQFNKSDFQNEFDFEDGEVVLWRSFDAFQCCPSTATKTYEYTDGLITKYNIVQAGYDGYYEVSFDVEYDNSNRIVGFLNEHSYNYSYVIEYDGNDMNFIDQHGNSNRSASIDSENNIIGYNNSTGNFGFQYENGNLKSENSGGDLIEYQYDNKKNPFNAPEFNKIAYVELIFNMIRGRSFMSGGDVSIFKNKNNIMLIKTRYLNEAPRDYPYSYKYNFDDYPVKKTQLITGGKVEFIYL